MVINELKQKYPITAILEVVDIPRSTYNGAYFVTFVLKGLSREALDELIYVCAYWDDGETTRYTRVAAVQASVLSLP